MATERIQTSLSRVEYLGSFKISARHLTTEPIPQREGNQRLYLCHCFTAGGLWSPKDETAEETTFMQHLTRVESILFEFVHDDNNRKSFNKIAMQLPYLGRKVFPMPATANEAIATVSNVGHFFLKEGKMQVVARYYEEKTKGCRWLERVTLLQKTKNFQCQDFSTLIHLADLTSNSVVTIDDDDVVIVDVLDPAPSVLVTDVQQESRESNREDHHSGLPAAVVATSIIGDKVTSHPILKEKGQVPVIDVQQESRESNREDHHSGLPAAVVATSIIGDKVNGDPILKEKDLCELRTSHYAALPEQSLDRVRFCRICNVKFDYIVELLIHLKVKPTCISAMKRKDPGKKKSIEVLTQYLNDSDTSVGFTCTECNATFGCVLIYCLHRDRHRLHPESHRFICTFCTGLFDVPRKFYRHSCFKTIEKMKTKHQAIPSNSRIYDPIRSSTLISLLKCPVCETCFRYSSRLVLHLNTNILCYNKLIRPGEQTFLDEIHKSRSGVPIEPVRCEICSLTFRSQLSYILHVDHHRLGGAEAGVRCKVCRTFKTSFCSFSIHNCQETASRWCFFCQNFRADEKCDPSPEETLVDENQLQIAATTTLVDNPGLKNIAQLWKKEKGRQTASDNKKFLKHESSSEEPTSVSGEIRAHLSETETKVSPLTVSIKKSESHPEENLGAEHNDPLQKHVYKFEILPTEQSTDVDFVMKNIEEVETETESAANNKNHVGLCTLEVDSSRVVESLTEDTEEASENLLPQNNEVADVEMTEVLSATKEEWDIDPADSYICSDCDYLKVIPNSNALLKHFLDNPDHLSVDPLSFYNQVLVKISNAISD